MEIFCRRCPLKGDEDVDEFSDVSFDAGVSGDFGHGA
jgi:hypothetical protein